MVLRYVYLHLLLGVFIGRYRVTTDIYKHFMQVFCNTNIKMSLIYVTASACRDSLFCTYILRSRYSVPRIASLRPLLWITMRRVRWLSGQSLAGSCFRPRAAWYAEERKKCTWSHQSPHVIYSDKKLKSLLYSVDLHTTHQLSNIPALDPNRRTCTAMWPGHLVGLQ